MNCFIAILLALQIMIINNDTEIKEPYIETFEQINDQVWYPFMQSYQDLDTEAFMRLHSAKLVRMDLNEGLQYDIDKKQALRINASYDWQDRVDANDDIKLAYMRYF